MKRVIGWFIDNSVAANLLMAILVIGGGLTLVSIRQEEFPSIDLEVVTISVAALPDSSVPWVAPSPMISAAQRVTDFRAAEGGSPWATALPAL